MRPYRTAEVVNRAEAIRRILRRRGYNVSLREVKEELAAEGIHVADAQIYAACGELRRIETLLNLWYPHLLEHVEPTDPEEEQPAREEEPQQERVTPSPSVQFLHAAGLHQHLGSVDSVVTYLQELRRLGVLT